MAVAALVDAAVPERVVRDALERIGVPGLKIGFERRKRGAFVGLGFTVGWPGEPAPQPCHPTPRVATEHRHARDGHGEVGHHHGGDRSDGPNHGGGRPGDGLSQRRRGKSGSGHAHRPYGAIRELVRRAELDVATKRLATNMFERLATVESVLHGVELDEVVFHEVGAWDSIADVVGVAAALAWLAPASVTSTYPVLGSGAVRTAHGLVPIPAPATAALLRGAPVLAEGEGELTTPTGAAILAAVVQAFAPAPPMRLVAQGFGAGSRDLPDRPNVLRVLLGEPLGRRVPSPEPEVVCVSANLDDMSPQLAEPLMSALFGAGALDVWYTPILMKKGRPAMEASALCPPHALAAVEAAFFEHSTTLGLRRQGFGRTVLERSMAKVRTAYGEVQVKIAARAGEILGATPEFEDCRRLAQRAQVPVRRVVAEASAAALALAAGRRRR
jgi:hypothetical protein